MPEWLKILLGSPRAGIKRAASSAWGFFCANAPESSKRLTMLMAAFTLCRGALRIAHAIAQAIYFGRPVDTGAVAALSAFVLPLAVMAGVAYAKKDGELAFGQAPSSDPSGDPK